MAIGTQTQGPLVTGLASTAPVTTPPPVITPDAVSALVNSFHNGVITGDDLAQHSGMMAFLRNRAEGQQLRESVGPEAVAQRQSAREAATAQNSLASQVAAAAAGNVESQAQLVSAQTAKAQADLLDKQAIDSYKALNPTIYKSDGVTPDYDAMADAGRQYVRAQGMLQYAAQGLAGTPSQEKNPKTGAPVTVVRNALGEDVTPVAGNKAYEHYSELRRQAMEVMFNPAKPHKSFNPDGAATTGSNLTPNESPDMTLVSPAVPAQAAAAPSVTPEYIPGQGRPTGPSNTVWDEGKITEELGKSPIYSNWANTRTQIPNFVSAANAINAIPASQQQTTNMNPLDIALAESLIKMYDPQGVIREFKWDKFQDNQPLLEKLKAAQQTLLHNGQFSPNVRQDLINLGKETLRSKEAGVKPQIALAVQRASSNPTTNIANVLDTQDLGLLSNKSATDDIKPWVSQVTAPLVPAAATPAANSGVVILKTGPYAGWKYDQRTGTVSQ